MDNRNKGDRLPATNSWTHTTHKILRITSRSRRYLLRDFNKYFSIFFNRWVWCFIYIHLIDLKNNYYLIFIINYIYSFQIQSYKTLTEQLKNNEHSLLASYYFGAYNQISGTFSLNPLSPYRRSALTLSSYSKTLST